jgi:hypothetical protein
MACLAVPLARAQGPAVNPLASRVDPYAERQRVVVMTDIANEPDDQMSMVRFLVYSNQFDVEGLIATTSTWMKNRVRPDVLETLVAAYGEVRPTLLNTTGIPGRRRTACGHRIGAAGYGMAAVGPGKMSRGAELIVSAADENDPRPLWVLAWGGANTLAQALLHVKATRTPAQLDALVASCASTPSPTRTTRGRGSVASSRAALHRHPVNPGRRAVLPRHVDRDQRRSLLQERARAPISPRSPTTWVNANIRSKGPLGKHYPMPCCIHEGDTPRSSA